MASATSREDIQAQKNPQTAKPENITVNGLDKARQSQAPNGGWRAWLQVLGSFLIFCVTWFAQFESNPCHSLLTSTPQGPSSVVWRFPVLLPDRSTERILRLKHLMDRDGSKLFGHVHWYLRWTCV